MRPLVRAAALLIFTSVAVAVAPRALRAQAAQAPVVGAAPVADDRARFEILSVGDSTFSFAVGPRQWVKAHVRGDAVDPRRRNAIVARFEVMTVSAGVATALITGETTRLTTAHVALIDVPHEAFYRKGTFWGGALAGLVFGAGIASAMK
jgi:hypothetical protein